MHYFWTAGLNVHTTRHCFWSVSLYLKQDCPHLRRLLQKEFWKKKTAVITRIAHYITLIVIRDTRVYISVRPLIPCVLWDLSCHHACCRLSTVFFGASSFSMPRIKGVPEGSHTLKCAKRDQHLAEVEGLHLVRSLLWKDAAHPDLNKAISSEIKNPIIKSNSFFFCSFKLFSILGFSKGKELFSFLKCTCK